MNRFQLFELASRQAQWLTVRQNVVAGNIANANTRTTGRKTSSPFEKRAPEHRYPNGRDASPPISPESPEAAHVTEVSALDDVAVQQSAIRSRSKRN